MPLHKTVSHNKSEFVLDLQSEATSAKYPKYLPTINPTPEIFTKQSH